MSLHKWELTTPEESKEITTTVAMVCPHCGTALKIDADVIREYLSLGAKIIQFRCPEPDCLSNHEYSDELDRPVLDLTDAEVSWAENSADAEGIDMKIYNVGD